MINRPELYLSLVNPRPKRVTILGEVERPGLYPLDTLATSFDAIVKAGGITLNADLRNVLLRRRTGGQGQQKETVLNLAQLMQFGNQLQDPMLLDGDTLVVGRTDQPMPDEVMQLSASNITPERITVTVLGAVNNPGSVSVPANTPLDDVILRAGGLVELTANQRRIELVRLNRNGVRTLDTYSFKENTGVSNKNNPPLRNGDTIYVRSNFYGKTLLVLNQFVFPIIRTGTTLINTYNIWDEFQYRYINNNSSGSFRRR
jgi:polysaccharide export outer membrane protein